MTNCVVTNNTAGNATPGTNGAGGQGGIGGGINISSGTVNLSNITITANNSGNASANGSGGDGGGIYNDGVSVMMVNCAVSNNGTGQGGNVDGASGGVGGGILNFSPMTAIGCTISNNFTRGPSAGLLPHNAGGGIFNSDQLTMINSTISGNQAHADAGRGGGIFQTGFGSLNLTNCTITTNSAETCCASQSGQGIHAGGTANVANTIISGNGNGSVPDVTGNFTSQGNNLIGRATPGSSNGVNGDESGFTDGANGDRVGSLGSPINALLGPLANNGGPTMTHALLPGSPAINAGGNANLPADTFDLDNNGNTTEPIPFDQRGFARVTNTTVDIGAFESRGFTISATGGTPQSTPINSAFGSGLTATVSSAFGEPVGGGLLSFIAPGSASSGTFAGGVAAVSVTTDNSGVAISPTFTANGTAGGPYNVTASANGVTGTASFSLTNLKGNQTINFGALPNKTFGDADFGVSATASSNLAVSFTASPLSVCTISGSTVHLTGAGSCTITAKQAGDSNYNAAPDVPQTFTINKATTSTAVTSSVNPSDFGESVTFTATVSSTAGTPTGTVQFKDGGGAITCANAGGQTLSGGVATCQISTLSAGPHTITADYSGDTNFASSSGTLSGGQVVRAQPSLSINDVSTTEGDSGTKNFVFTVTLSAASHLQVKVDFATADGTAKTADSDYQSNSGTLTFNAGDTTKTITVLVNGDQKFEPNETFFVNLSNPVNTTISDNQGLGTIVNDDAQGGIISFSQSNYSVAEGGFVVINVNRTGDTSSTATVNYATSDGTAALVPCSTTNGLASSRCDFTTTLGTLKFAAGEGNKTFTILTSQDNYVEGPETFSLSLSNLTGGAVFGPNATATVTILDDATEPATNPIDDARVFVIQHYHDFLNREPDQAGLDFWTNQITVCGSDVGCTEVRRINVSVSFFLSIEFQETGYLVERLYKAGYGDALNSSTFPTAHQLNVPVIRVDEFLSDTQQIGQGVIVGQGNWQQLLENNKQAFIADFVQRPRFMTAFPTSMTPDQFVDKLNQNAGNPLSQSERDQLVNDLSTNTKTRAQVLRAVAEDQDLVNAEFNRAFVLMQYFGYLRRNPNDPQDSDYTGYDFWLTKLNQFNGNYINAEMVKAFLSSVEYRQRFGP
jgi:hypothetical protein